jgi:hypothetical protein
MCLTCGCDELPRTRRALEPADPDDPQPDETVLIATEDALARAESWIGWSGQAVMSRGSAWTPHKALRRITDHFIDHLTQIECRVANVAPVPDTWRGRQVTLESDWARFTESDLDEATARVRRLAQVLALRLRRLQAEWDRDAGDEWTIRFIAKHVAEAISDYANTPMATPVSKPKG